MKAEVGTMFRILISERNAGGFDQCLARALKDFVVHVVECSAQIVSLNVLDNDCTPHVG